MPYCQIKENLPCQNEATSTRYLIIGSGPIVIGQACEFDYSGTQACKALKKLGYKIILVNSNPATIMTDPGTADVTYIESLNIPSLIEIIENERPDAILPNLGGQTGLNLTSELQKQGILDKFGVKVIGVSIDAIKRGEDRIAFKETMNRLGIDMPKSEPAYTIEEAEKIAAGLGYPVVVRPAYTMGGTGGGIAASMVGQILIEESVLGWEELELEVVRDAKNQMITVCFIENVDAMGVHTGDSYRSLEKSRYGLGFAKDFHQKTLDELYELVADPSSERQYIIYEALRKGAGIETLFRRTHIKPWFIQQMKELVDLEEEILKFKEQSLPDDLLLRAKQDGFADRYLAQILGVPEGDVRRQRLALGMVECWDAVPVSGVENAAYYYSTYNAPDRVAISKNKKIMVLGGGPNRIGQGNEFDYCCVHAAFTLRDEGYESIMVNCNPETVSTDYDTSDKLYFEPLTVEDVLSIYAKEKPVGVIVQFGGQTPLNIAQDLARAGVKIIGTSPETIDLAEDRDRFREMMKKLGIPMPESGMAGNLTEARAVAARIGYPLMLRPSYVLGGRGMEVVHDEEMLRRYVERAVGVTPERPILIDKFLENAIEVEADAISDGVDAFVPAIMEHIELAGIHSGDSACVIPPISISARHMGTINDYTSRIAVAFGVIGLMNIQYAIASDVVYILEANPRAYRTVPLVSKVCNISMARIATQVILGKKLADFKFKPRVIPHFGVKEAVFPFNMFQEVDPLLGPEMRSTGEVLGLADSFGLAFYKAEEAAQQVLPGKGTVLLTVNDRDKGGVLEVARCFHQLEFRIMTTGGTHRFLANEGIPSESLLKMHEGRPNIVDAIKNGGIHLIINTPSGKLSQHDDSYIRKAAIQYKIPYITTIAAFRKGHGRAKSLQDYHADIR